MKMILVLGAGKSATVLIRTLLETCAVYGWHLTVADQDPAAAMAKLGGSNHGTALEINVQDDLARTSAVLAADLVISLLPPALHHLVAIDCLNEGRNLLTASYADAKMLALDAEIRAKSLLFLCEMGLDPGIDHMSAMKLIDEIRVRGGKITSFLSHCGGLVAPESDDNPWHYKISWNPANVITAGMAGAIFLKDGRQIELCYDEIFTQGDEISFPGLGRWMVYPNRDSLKYRSLYALNDTHTFVRTTIRHPEFMRGWSALVKAGLTSEVTVKASSIAEWASPILPFINTGNRQLFDYLGLLEEQPVGAAESKQVSEHGTPGNRPVPAAGTTKLPESGLSGTQRFNAASTTQLPESGLSGTQRFNTAGLSSSKMLQSLLERKLAMKQSDKDMILMLHQVEYDLDGKIYKVESSFRMDGFDSSYTAMATTVGLPLAHAAELILKGQINLTGVQIPMSKEIYQKILPMLEEDGIVFTEVHR